MYGEVYRLEPDKKRKKKHKVKYSILFVPDVATADVKRFAISMKVVISICVGIVLLISSAFIYCYYLTDHVLVANTSINSLRTEVETLTTEKETLSTQNKELQEKVLILSDTINDKVQQEEAREAEIAKEHIPTGFPLKGTASYNEETTTLDEQPAAIFTAGAGTSVLSTASGTVSAIAGDDDLGYIVMIDHGNGYYSVYRNGSKPLVTEGAEVTTATELFVIEAGKEELGYQIIENDSYIDPLSLMEIYG